jgi:hypothetical protein
VLIFPIRTTEKKVWFGGLCRIFCRAYLLGGAKERGNPLLLVDMVWDTFNRHPGDIRFASD